MYFDLLLLSVLSSKTEKLCRRGGVKLEYARYEDGSWCSR